MLVQAIAGDENAFELLFERQRGWLVAYADYRLRAKGGVMGMGGVDFVRILEDKVRRTIRHFVRKLDDVTLMDAFQSYLKTILRRDVDEKSNTANAKFIRIESNLSAEHGPVDLAEMARSKRTRGTRIVSQAETIQFMKKCLEKLDPLHRQVFESHFADELSYADIEKQTGLTEGQIKGILFRTVKRVQNSMGRPSRWEHSKY